MRLRSGLDWNNIKVNLERQKRNVEKKGRRKIKYCRIRVEWWVITAHVLVVKQHCCSRSETIDKARKRPKKTIFMLSSGSKLSELSDGKLELFYGYLDFS